MDTTQSPGSESHWQQQKRAQAWERQREQARRILNEYDPPEYTVAELADLRIDERYQRARNEAKVNMLRATFEPNACQPLAISQRADGTRYLVDGQHRAAALEDIGVKSWPALIYRKLTRRDEAAMWLELNTRQTKPQPPERFRAALERKEPQALAITNVVTAAGFHLNLRRGGSGGRAGRVSGEQVDAIEALIQIFRQSRDPGLRDVLTLIRTAWPDPEETQRTQRLVLLGIAAFLGGAWAPKIDVVRAAQVIGRYTPGVWMAKTRGVTSGESPPQIFCEKIKAAYNKTAPRGERL
jgi:hypothetical protein